MKSCTIITTSPNERVAKIHDRMPVILTGEKMWNWPTWSDAGQLKTLLTPFLAEQMQAVRVGGMVSNPNVDVPGLISPIQDEFDKNP